MLYEQKETASGSKKLSAKAKGVRVRKDSEEARADRYLDKKILKIKYR